MAKGQAFLSDFSISMAVFGIILVAFFIPWNSVIEADTRFSQSEEMKTQARRTASFLVSTEGYPNNWEEEGVGVVVPGFANEDNVLSMDKMLEFASLKYEEQRSLMKSQGFSMNFVDSETGEVVGFDRSKHEGEELSSYLGLDPIAYMVEPGSSLSNLEMLNDLNSSDREWYFYFPSGGYQSQLDSLTAEEVYTNDGSGVPMMEKMISDSADKGWNQFKVGSKIAAAYTSEIADVDGDGGLEVFYKDTNGRLNLYDFQTGETRRIDTVTGFGRIGAVDDFTASEGLELAYVDSNDQLAFYNFNTDAVTGTPAGAIDVGDATQISGETALFYINQNNDLAYYIQGSGSTVTSFNGRRIGGVGDVDGDGTREVAYMNGNDNLAFYSIDSGTTDTTSEQVVDVGWIDGGLTGIISNNNGYSGVWNYSSSSFSSSGAQSQSVTDFTEIDGRKSLVYIDTVQNQNIAFYDTENGLKRFLRIGDGQDIRADDGGWRIDIPGYGRSFAYQDGNGNLNFYSRAEDTTLHTGIQVQHVGGAGDVDNDGNEELVYIDNANGNLEYYDFDDGEVMVAEEGGSPVRGSDVGVPADVDNDGVVEAVFQDNNFLAYYDYQDDQVTTWNSVGQIRSIGGSADIDRDGNPEIIYISNSNGNMWHYDPVNDQKVDTGQSAESYVGGAANITGSSELEIVYRNNNQRIAYYNPATGSSTEETITITGAGTVLPLTGDKGVDAIVTNTDSRLGYFDFSLSLNYNTVIAENVGLQPGNIDNSQILRSAVENGMTYLHSRNSIEILTQTFSMDEQSPGSNTAEIQQVEPLLNNESFSAGEEITFSNVQGGFQNVDTVFANATASPNSCLACMQRIGEGKVYYLADMSAGATQSGFTNTNEVIRAEGNAVNPFDFGKDIPESAETVVVVKRQVVINKSGEFEKAELRLKLWR